MRRGLEIPQTVECWDNGVEIAKAFLESPHSFEPPRFIFASTTWDQFHSGFFDVFQSFWPDGTYGKRVDVDGGGWYEVDKQPNTVIVYPPIINGVSEQKLHVVTVNLTPLNGGHQGISSEEKSLAQREWAKRAEANCIVLFIGLYDWCIDRG
ncbi:hypothetical protein AAVH_20444 [Aphelenchoides avenae]|nr:hypothetical protein AAVH_20444 [Aphelenchus avenae]